MSPAGFPLEDVLSAVPCLPLVTVISCLSLTITTRRNGSWTAKLGEIQSLVVTVKHSAPFCVAVQKKSAHGVNLRCNPSKHLDWDRCESVLRTRNEDIYRWTTKRRFVYHEATVNEYTGGL